MNYKFKIPIYGVEVYFYPSFEDMPKNFKLNSNCSASTFYINATPLQAESIGIAIKDYNWYNPDTITHEAVHAAWKILHLVGIKCSANNNEPMAYLVGYIVKKINNYMDKYLKGIGL